MEWASLAVALVALLLSIAHAVRGRHLSRPALRLHLGVAAFDPNRPTIVRTRPKRLIIYGVPPLDRDFFLLPIVIGLENLTALPITDVEVQLEYAAESLIDGAKIRDQQAGTFTMNLAAAADRTAKKVGDVAQVKFESHVLRAKEKRAIFELVRIPCGHALAGADDVDQTRLQDRWSQSPAFGGAITVRISVWSANCEPVSMKGVIAVCYAYDERQLAVHAQDLVARLWDGYKPGNRAALKIRTVLGRRSSWSLEHAELVFLSQDALDTEKVEANPIILRRAPHAVLQFARPPWDFTGRAFDAAGIQQSASDDGGA